MAQSSPTQPPIQRPYFAHPPPPTHLMKPTALPQHEKPLRSLQSSLNFMIIETGKTMRSAVLRRDPKRNMDESARRVALDADTEKLRLYMAGTIPIFHNALDEMEAEIVGARAIIGRDLRVLRARKNMTTAEKAAEEKKATGKEIEAAVGAMEDVVGPQEKGKAVASQHANAQDDLNISMDHDKNVDDSGTGSESIQAEHDSTEESKAGQNNLGISHSLHNLADLEATNNTAMPGVIQQNQLSPITSGHPPLRPRFKSAREPSQAEIRTLHLMEQHQQQQLQLQQQQQQFQQQQEQFLQNQQLNQQLQQQKQSQTSPHTPAMQTRAMPEDNIAFNALPGTVPNSPKAKDSPISILPPASHNLVTQAGGINIPAESLPLLPDQMRSQITQVHSQAVLEAQGVHPHIAAQVTDPNPPDFDTPSAAQQQQNISQSQQNQPTLASPFQPQGHNPQHQQNQIPNQQSQQLAAPPQSHDEINFDAMFAGDATNQDAAEADIDFDDFFKDLVDDNAQGSANNNAGGAAIGGLEGANEIGAADFDLSTFGMDGDAGAAAGGDMGAGGADATMADLEFRGLGQNNAGGTGGGGAGVGLGLGMLEGLESYANQATDDDAMDGLDFSGDLDLGGDVNLNLNDAQPGQNNNGNSNPSANPGFGDANAGDNAGFGMSNADLDAAMNMSMDQGTMDQGTSFDDLLDNMDFGGGNGGGEGGDGSGGNPETSEFDDAFFGL